jgi:hypothetical protein
VTLALCLGIWPGVTSCAEARVVRVVVESDEPDEPDKESANAKVPYEGIRSLVYGEVDPQDRGRTAAMQPSKASQDEADQSSTPVSGLRQSLPSRAR